MKNYGRYTVAGLAMAGVTATTALLGLGTAAANPANHPLLTTTCSFAQIDRALHAEFPKAAARVDANPQHTAKLQQLLSLPPAARAAQIHQFMAANPAMAAKHRQWAAANPAKVAKRQAAAARLAATCHNY